MRVRKLIGPVLLLLLVILAGCNMPGGVSDEDAVEFAAQTLEARMTQDAGGQAPADAGQPGDAPTAPGDQAQPGDAPTATVPPSATVEPSVTPTPTITLTVTPSVPMVSVSVDTNCRVGPSTQYDYLGALLVGEQAEVVGRSSDGQYWIIKNPDAGGNCWLWANYATVVGDTSALPIVTPPPTPTPTLTPTPEFTWDGTWSCWAYGGLATFSMTLSTSGNTVSGSFISGGDTINVAGTVGGDGKTVNGTWENTSASTNGTFYWQAKKNINQFVGNVDGGSNDWCGARSGASQPSPCLAP